EIELHNGFIEATTPNGLKGSKIYLDFPSVGATQNIMMAAVLADGKTEIQNVAREPEIVDLANYLNEMGAQVHGAGTDTIKIIGVGTFMIAGAITRDNINVIGAIREHMSSLVSKLEEAGVQITEIKDGLNIQVPGEIKAIDVKTMPHPGFPTDMQSQIMALLL